MRLARQRHLLDLIRIRSRISVTQNTCQRSGMPPLGGPVLIWAWRTRVRRPGHCHGNRDEREFALSKADLRGGCRDLPLLRDRGSKEAQRRSGDQMALEVEEIVDGAWTERKRCAD